MPRVYSLDGRCYDVDSATLDRHEIPRERVAGMMAADDLPDAPPPGELPNRGIPPHILAQMGQVGVELPIPEEARRFVRVRATPEGGLVIDVNVAALGFAGQAGPRPGGSAGPGSCGPSACGSNGCE